MKITKFSTLVSMVRDSGGMVSYTIHGVKQCAIQLHPGLVGDTVGIMSGYDFSIIMIYIQSLLM